MNSETRQNEIKGSLDERVLALELSLLNRWEKWFGKHPGTVLGIVVVSLFTGFWYYHTWQIERIDRQHENELSRIELENKTKIEWLKNQQAASLLSERDMFEIEKKRILLELEMCKTNNNK